MKNIAVVPARGGSKRVPGKNIIEFFGKPMIVHTLEAAKESGVFSKIIVSTEDDTIRSVVEQHGYEVVRRPEEFATDTVSLVPSVLHVIAHFESLGDVFENACLLMANCPIRDRDDIRGSCEAFHRTASDFMMTVFRYGMFYPFWAMKQTGDGLKSYWGEKYIQSRSQELPDVFCPSGAIRWFSVEAFKKIRNFYGPNLQPYIIPWYKAIDIDGFEDLMMAKMVVAAMERHAEYFI